MNDSKINDELKSGARGEVEVKINHVVPESSTVLYCDQAIVRHNAGVFVVSFFQSRIPFVFEREDLAQVESVDSICVAQIAMTPEQFFRTRNAMIQNYDKYLETIEHSAEVEVVGKDERNDKV